MNSRAQNAIGRMLSAIKSAVSLLVHRASKTEAALARIEAQLEALAAEQRTQRALIEAQKGRY